ncbi:MAG TPA: hypothetical protein PKN09_08945 [Novosphingobium sp.]|jgi:hypothetical protein|nr:hypothetical protein [Novosphingobium sp.]
MPERNSNFTRRKSRLLNTKDSLILLALGILLPSPAMAATADEARPQGSDEPYVDRLIDGGNLVPLTVAGEEQTGNSKGNVRSLVVELGGSVISPKSRITGIDTSALDRAQREGSISVSGRYQTDNFGLVGLDAQLRRGSNSGPFSISSKDTWNGSITLTSRDLPLGNGWLADSAAGMTTTPTIALVRRQTRFYLPSTPILGGSATFKHYRRLSSSQAASEPEPIASFNLSIGEPGLLGGLRLSNFARLSGLAVSGGGQTDLGPGWAAGIQTIAVKDTLDPYAVILQTTPGSSGLSRVSSQGALGTIAYSNAGVRVQANAIWSHRSGASSSSDLFGGDGAAGGGWVDASYRSGKTLHSGGLYYFGPGLSWGTSALINNAYGGYYRFSTSSQRWRWTVNLDAVNSVDGRGSSGVIANADVRRKLNFSTSIGLNSTVRVANGQTATQILGFVDFTTKLGSSRAEAGWSHDPSSDLWRAGFNQNWALPVWLPSGSRLSTQVAYEHRRQYSNSPSLLDGSLIAKANSFGAAISAGATPFSGISFDATAAYNSNGSSSPTGIYGPIDATGGALSNLSSEQGRAFSASIVATVRLSSNWSLSASYTDTTSRLASLFGLANPNVSHLGPSPSELADVRRSSYHLRAGYLTLRYSTSAGRPRGSLGLRQFPVGGTGNLEGRIYLDANDSGVREPAESGVGGIIVILDGIQAVRSDQSGYYRFEGVSDGQHHITLNADMLPLPWVIEPGDKRRTGEPYVATIEVGVRSTTTLDIAASRE